MDEQFQDDNARDAAQYEAEFADMFEQQRTNAALDFAAQFDDAKPQDIVSVPAEENTTSGDLSPDEESGLLERGIDAGLGVGRDLGIGVLSSPRSVARGAINGVNSILEITDSVHNFMTNTIFGRDANIDIAQIPNFAKPEIETVTGNAVELLTEFAVGFKGVDKAFKASKFLSGAEKVAKGTRSGTIAVNSVKGAAADMVVFDAQEDRLSNLIQDVPALQNPVTEYLESDADDGAVEAKFKQAIEGLALGGFTDVVFDGVRIMKKARRTRQGLDENASDDLFNVPPEEQAGIGVDADTFEYLGRADTDDFVLRKEKKLDVATDEVQGAFGKTKQVKKGVNPEIDDFEINFARIEGGEDIKQLMDEMVNRPELKESIDAARRGVRDERTTLKAASDIDGFDELMARRTGDAFNSDSIVAARKVYYDTTAKLMDAAKRAADPEASDVDVFNFRKMVAVHHAVQKEFMGVRAEAGRALQAWKIPVGGGGAENARALEQVLNEFGGATSGKDLAKRIAARGNNLNTSQLNAMTTKAASARTADALTEAWTLGLLTNPTTHIVNISSNVLTGLTLGAERLFASTLKDSPVSLREGVEYFVGMMDAQKAGMKNAAEAFRTGQTGIGISKLDLPRTRNTARDILDPDGRAGIFSAALDWYGGQLSKYAGGILAAGDEYSKTVLYQSQVRALAVRDGIAQGLEADELGKHIARTLAEPPSNIRADAVDYANYGTFTRELGSAGQAVQRIIAEHPTARFVVPFVRTPINIFKFTFERTPLGLISSKMRDDIAAGGVREAMAKSKLGMGTSVMAIGADMAMNGKITGSGPSDSKQRAALRRTGWQPYSIKIDDTYYSYSRFEPMATILGMSADMSEILTNYEAYDIDAQKSADQLVTAAAISVGNQVVGKTFLRGFSDLVEVLSDPGRYGEGYVNRFAGSFVPAGVAGIERALSPETSQVFNMMDQMKSRIPGLSDGVPPRRNIWGEEIKMFYPSNNMIEGGAQRLMSMFNPIYYSQEKDAPIDKWMLENGFNVNMPQKRQTFDGVKIDLRDTPAAYDRLVTLRGNEIELMRYGNQTMRQFFDGLANQDDPFGRHVSFFMEFGNDFDDQQAFINKVVRDYNDAAKEQILQEFPDLSVRILQERANAERVNAVRPPIEESLNE